MTSQVIKITSRQNQPITSSKNLVDFDIPSGVFDLSKSYLNVNVSLPGKNPNNVTLLSLARNTDAEYEPNTDFIRNVSLKSQTMGTIENLRNINILKKNQQLYEESVSKSNSSEIISKMGCRKDLNNLSSSNYRTIEKLGTVLSAEKSHDHVIRLKDLMNFCKNDYYDTNEKGQLQMHLEFETTGFDTIQQIKEDDDIWDQKKGDNAAPLYKAMADIAAGALTVTELSTKKKYFNLDESPFYVGMEITISSAQLAANAGRQVVGIEYNNDYTLKLTLSSAITFNNPATDVTAVSVEETAPLNQPVFNSCELVLVEVDQKPGKNTYQYTSYELQEDTVNTNTLVKNYHLPAMSKNVFVVTPSSSTRFMSNVPIQSYRTALDNVYQQNRPVIFSANRDPLHVAQIIKTYDNMDTRLKNLQGTAPEIDVTLSNQSVAPKRSYMILQPVDKLGQSKMLSLEINSVPAPGLPLSRVLIFSEVVKMM